jgi:hypothetical protein
VNWTADLEAEALFGNRRRSVVIEGTDDGESERKIGAALREKITRGATRAGEGGGPGVAA